jgi:hypothetical protein
MVSTLSEKKPDLRRIGDGRRYVRIISAKRFGNDAGRQAALRA